MTLTTRRAIASFCMLVNLAACAPALDWRDVHPAGSALTLQFPCRPDSQARSVSLAGAPVLLTLRVCSARDLTFGLVQADLGDPSRVGPALAALQAGAAANIGALPGGVSPQTVPGATPQRGAGRLRLAGQRPGGSSVHLDTLVFARGTVAYQASVLGDAPAGDAADTYFESIRFQP
jgi:hypothetical protein